MVCIVYLQQKLYLQYLSAAIVAVVALVTNLTKRHPNCRVLLHRPEEGEYIFTSDPYDMDEPDPAKSHALESCLWELKVRQ